jgi:hypothetical protein
MKEPTPAIMQEACELIERFRSGRLDDEQLSEIAIRLDRLLPDPEWLGYAVDHVPELTAEEVVRRALGHAAIEL